MEENRINRRSRPRPYDLRRKVLLKNFLREQMTYIPLIQLTSVIPNNDSNFSEESSNSEADLQDLNDENNSCSTVSSENIQSNVDSFDINENLASDSKKNETDVNDLDNTHAHEESHAVVNEPKSFKFTSLINLRRRSKTNKVKGILKAKKVCKTVKHPVSSKSIRSTIEKVFSRRSRTSREKSHDETSKNSKHIFSLFKSRRELRRVQRSDSCNSSTKNDAIVATETTKYGTSNQSVQTDESWTREELKKVQQSNRLLREENRLLTESLSYFMSSASNSQVNHSTNNPLQSSPQKFGNLRRFSSYYNDFSSGTSNNSSNWNSRSKIFRSKSVQEHGDRRPIIRNNYRTRSMSSHNTQDNFVWNARPTSRSSLGIQPQRISIPRAREKNILATLPVNSTGRVVRRSSMPERELSENDRSRICRRSDSLRYSSYRRPFSTLPSDAFY